MDKDATLSLILIFLPIFIIIFSIIRGKKNKKAFEKKLADSNSETERACAKIARLEEDRNSLRKKYGPILDIEGHAAKLLDDAKKDAKSRRNEADRYAASKQEQSVKLLAEAQAEADKIRQEAKSLRSEASQQVRNSKEKADAIKNEARE
ncbi:hypothetical protein [Vibrio nereis]|uniref:hypothetical protein n=1 Tax=Vibrio nereis TaxID=693 RepID=UPI0024945669|nr:hypothetical protein [Vibrio nereis]